MRSRITEDFRRSFERLPEAVAEQAIRAYLFWRSNPYHPSLQFKRVSQREAIYSVRVGMDYRALGLRIEDEIHWFWIGTHAKYDHFLKHF